jgi:hypothetical protein
MNYWVDRVRNSNSPPDIVVIPVSYVAPEEFHEQLKQILAPEDEIVTSVDDVKNDWTFVIKSGDVFPVQIIASTQTTFDNSSFDRMFFPVVYRGHIVMEDRLFKKSGDVTVQSANMPIFNLNKYDIDKP